MAEFVQDTNKDTVQSFSKAREVFEDNVRRILIEDGIPATNAQIKRLIDDMA